MNQKKMKGKIMKLWQIRIMIKKWIKKIKK